MSTGEYIDELLDEIISLKMQRDFYETENEHLLKLIFSSIESPSYLNPWGIFKFLESVYPNRWQKKMESFNASRD